MRHILRIRSLSQHFRFLAIPLLIMMAGLAVSMFFMDSLPSFAAGNTYYVSTTGSDANPGTQAAPFRTIAKGVSVAQAGDTVNVMAGTYTESVTSWNNGSSGNPITVQPFGYNGTFGSGDVVTWTGTGSSETNKIGAIEINDRNYIRIQGFMFKNTVGLSAVRVLNNFLWDSTGTARSSHKIVGIEILNNTFTNNGNNGKANCSTTGASTAISLTGVGQESNPGMTLNTIKGNVFSGNYGHDIILSSSNDVLIDDNTSTGLKGAQDVNNSSGYMARSIFYCCEGPYDGGILYPSNRNIIQNNKISNITRQSYMNSPLTCGQSWLEAAGIRQDANRTNVGNIIQDNTIHDMAWGAGAWSFENRGYGVFLEIGGNTIIRRNVVYNVSEAGLEDGTSARVNVGNQWLNNTVYNFYAVGLLVGGAQNGIFRNNIVYGPNASAQVSFYNSGSECCRTGNTFSNNLYYKTSGAAIGRWDAPSGSGFNAANLSLSQWNANSGETGDINADPLFVNAVAADFHLQSSSPAKGAGYGGVDIGAYPNAAGTPTPTPTPTPSSSSSPLPIPGRVEAESYRSGGEGAGYHDTTIGNSGDYTLRGDDVDIKNTADGPTVGWTTNGEWLQYNVTVSTAGTYTPTLRVANGNITTAQIHLELDGTSQGTIAIPATGSWNTQANVAAPSISMSAGAHTLRVVFDITPVDLNYLDFALAATPTPTPGPVACHQYTSTSAIPAGFGSPYDVLSSPTTNLMNATCLNLTDARLDLGKGDPLQYIYNQGYLFKTGGAAWTPVPYTSTESLIAGAWYPKSATATLSLTSTELAQDSYVLSYMCSWTGSGWKCGCRDSACTQSYWQIQSFKR
jgi:hypothetical protein